MADKIRRYEMCTDSNIWKDEIENVLENGYFIADMGSNWDLWRLGDMTYSLAKEGTGASPSFWCHTSKLRAHLYAGSYTHRMHRITTGNKRLR